VKPNIWRRVGRIGRISSSTNSKGDLRFAETADFIDHLNYSNVPRQEPPIALTVKNVAASSCGKLSRVSSPVTNHRCPCGNAPMLSHRPDDLFLNQSSHIVSHSRSMTMEAVILPSKQLPTRNEQRDTRNDSWPPRSPFAAGGTIPGSEQKSQRREV